MALVLTWIKGNPMALAGIDAAGAERSMPAEMRPYHSRRIAEDRRETPAPAVDGCQGPVSAKAYGDYSFPGGTSHAAHSSHSLSRHRETP
jgi:hypothetical protein